MRRRIGVSQNNILQGDNLQINNGSTASVSFNFTGSSDLSFNLPGVDGSSGWALKTDGLGNLSFGIVASTGGATGATGSSGTSGSSGSSGISGSSGSSGNSGSSGSSGNSGSSGSSGNSGTSGISGSSGSSGVNGASGSSGISGSSGSSGNSGSSGSSGNSGTSGISGSSGSSGVNGASGSSGLNGLGSVASGTTNYMTKFTGATALGNSTVIDNGTQVLLVNNGSTATPSIAFNNSTGTGLHTASNELRISAQGILSQQITSVSTRFTNGTTASPAISFLSDSSTGFSRSTSSQINVSVGGSEVSRFTTAQFQLVNGSQGVPSIAFVNSATTGIYRAGTNIMGFSSGGVLKFTIAPTYIHSVNPHWFSDGSVSEPAITFNSETTTGFYRAAAGALGVAISGSLGLGVVLTGGVIQTRHDAGTALLPSMTFLADTTTGFYRAASGVVGVASSGVEAMRIGANTTVAIGTFRVPSGSVTLPSYSFGNNSNTGLWNPSTNQIAISVGGVTNSIFGTTNSISAQTFFDKAVNHTPTTNTSVTGTYSLDMSASNIFILTLTGNTVLTTTNRNVGSYMVYIKQDGTGGRTFALSGNAEFLGATAISIGTASNAVSILQLVCVGTQSIATSQKNLTNL